MSKYSSRILCVNCQDSGPSVHNLQGILLHALPHTSRRLFLGALPDPRIVDDTNDIEEEGVLFESVDISKQFRKQHTQDMFEINFKKPKTLYNREKEPKPQDIRNNKLWASPPGWITCIEFERRKTDLGQTGGARKEIKFRNFPKQGASKYDNAHNRCYMNAALQLLLSLEPFVETIEGSTISITTDLKGIISPISLINAQEKSASAKPLAKKDQVYYKLILDTLRSLIKNLKEKQIADTVNINVHTNVNFTTVENDNKISTVLSDKIKIENHDMPKKTVYDIFKFLMTKKLGRKKVEKKDVYENNYKPDSQQDAFEFFLEITSIFQYGIMFEKILPQIFFIERNFNFDTNKYSDNTAYNFSLTLPIHGTSIQSSITQYMKKEKVELGGKMIDQEIRFEFFETFTYLIIQLNRFHFDSKVSTANALESMSEEEQIRKAKEASLQGKNTDPINMDKQITIKSEKNPFIGTLIGCIEHEGATSNSGHYIYTKFDNGTATRYDDAAEPQVITNYNYKTNTSCYILLYKKVGGVIPEVSGETPEDDGEIQEVPEKQGPQKKDPEKQGPQKKDPENQGPQKNDPENQGPQKNDPETVDKDTRATELNTEESNKKDCPEVKPIHSDKELEQWIQTLDEGARKEIKENIIYKIPKNLLAKIENKHCVREIEQELSPCCENVRAFIWSYYLHLLKLREKDAKNF